MKKLFAPAAIFVLIAAIVTVTLAGGFLQARTVNESCQLGSRKALLPLEQRRKLIGEGQYQWVKGKRDFYARHLCELWQHPVSMRRMEGLISSAVQVTAQSDSACKRDIEQDRPPLRIEGGLCRKTHWLLVNDEGQKTFIKSFEELRRQYPFVRTPAMAFSFVAVTEPDILLDDEGLVSGHVMPVRNGYLVQVTKKNTYGCGWHVPVGMVFYVTKSGYVTKVAAQREGPGGTVCVD